MAGLQNNGCTMQPLFQNFQIWALRKLSLTGGKKLQVYRKKNLSSILVTLKRKPPFAMLAFPVGQIQVLHCKGRFIKDSLLLSTNFKKACIMHPGVKSPVAGRNHRYMHQK